MKPWVKDRAIAAVGMLVLCGAPSLACSSSHVGDPSRHTASVAPQQRPPLDPLRAGASIGCDAGSDDGGPSGFAAYMLAPMNHKLQSYPDFAAAIGVTLVSDCDTGRLFMRGYE